MPDPDSSAPVKICYSIFQPAAATAKRKVPMLLHSHGWGGSRTKDAASFKRFLDAGYGVLSFDQRGFGESGGHAHVDEPDFEGHDVRALVKLVSTLPWVKQDRPGDPRLGAIGGSYGGGYQFLGAFEEIRVQGRQVFDALAPEITWYDLYQSLAPEGVVRTEWALALSAAGVPTDALPQKIYKALVEGAVTGTWPDGSIPGTENLKEFFRKNGPRWHVTSGPQDHRAGAVRAGHDRHAVRVGAGSEQLAARAGHERARRASTSATTAATCCPRSTRRASTSPLTRAARGWRAATSRRSRSGSSTSSSRARRPR